MTLDEALERIRAAGPCFVVFDAETGEVLEVHPEGDREPETLLTNMDAASKAHGAVKGRYLDGAKVTRALLQREVKEARDVAMRVTTFSRWAVMPAEELVRVLETDRFADPLDAFHGPSLLIERIFDYSPEVLRPLVPRLERPRRRFEDPVYRDLQSRLAVLAGDLGRLKAIWKLEPGPNALVWHPGLLAMLGDLRPADPEAIEMLVDTVSHRDLMFGPRFEAMRALGKIGAPAGPRAARGIRDKIYDSGPEVVALRERVLERIETPESEWAGCPRCTWGKVPGRPWGAPELCATCLGLGFVRRAA